VHVDISGRQRIFLGGLKFTINGNQSLAHGFEEIVEFKKFQTDGIYTCMIMHVYIYPYIYIYTCINLPNGNQFMMGERNKDHRKEIWN